MFVIIDGDELLDSAKAGVLEGTCVDVAMNPVVLDNVNASTLLLTAVDDDNALLLEAAGADVEVLASPAVLKDVTSDLSEVAVVFVIIDGDELLDSVTAEVLEGTGVDVAMNPVVLDYVNASTLVLTAVDVNLTMTTRYCSRLRMQTWRRLLLLQCSRMSLLPWEKTLTSRTLLSTWEQACCP